MVSGVFPGHPDNLTTICSQFNDPFINDFEHSFLSLSFENKRFFVNSPPLQSSLRSFKRGAKPLAKLPTSQQPPLFQLKI